MSDQRGPEGIVREFQDEPACQCDLCGQQMPQVLIVEHLATAHLIDPEDVATADGAS